MAFDRSGIRSSLWRPAGPERAIGPGSAAVRKAVDTVNDRLALQGYSKMNTPVRFTEGGGIVFNKGGKGTAPAYPNLQFWDEVKRHA